MMKLVWLILGIIQEKYLVTFIQILGLNLSFNKNGWLPGFVLISGWIEITMEDNIDDIIKNIRFTNKLFKNGVCINI